MWTKETLEKAAADYATMTCTFSEDSGEIALYKAFLEGANFILNKQQKDQYRFYEMRTFIYINDIFKYTYTEHPMMKFPDTSHTYVSLEAIKKCMNEENFKNLQIKLRTI